MPNFQAKHIEDLEHGVQVEIKGRRYLRMVDHPSRHIEGWVVDLETGWSGHWSRLILGNETVTCDARWHCKACRAVEATHCANPDECGHMKLAKL